MVILQYSRLGHYLDYFTHSEYSGLLNAPENSDKDGKGSRKQACWRKRDVLTHLKNRQNFRTFGFGFIELFSKVGHFKIRLWSLRRVSVEAGRLSIKEVTVKLHILDVVLDKKISIVLFDVVNLLFPKTIIFQLYLIVSIIVSTLESCVDFGIWLLNWTALLPSSVTLCGLHLLLGNSSLDNFPLGLHLISFLGLRRLWFKDFLFSYRMCFSPSLFVLFILVFSFF